MIYNRLKAGMTLGIDATLRYGFDIPPTESIRQSQLDSNHLYNTRKLPADTHADRQPGAGLDAGRGTSGEGRLPLLVRKPDKVHHFFTASEREFENYKNAHGY